MSESNQQLPIDLRTINKPNKRQRRFVDAYLNPMSETFGNAYKSARKAGFTDTTARVLTANSRQTPWIQEVKQLLSKLEPEHIYLAIQHIALTGKADRDKLRALELMGKHQGMFEDTTHKTEVNISFNNSVPRPHKIVDATVVETVDLNPAAKPAVPVTD